MSWNNRYNMQKTADPNLILHGIGQLGSGVWDIARGVGHGIGHELHNMAHPFTGGGPAYRNAEDAYLKMLDTPGTWDSPPGNGPHLYNKMISHEYDFVPQAVSALAGYAATGLGIAKGYHAVKSRLQGSREENARQNDPRLVSRKQHWDNMHPFARELSLDIDGPTANPHHPNHDLSNDYFGTYGMGTEHPTTKAYDNIPRRPTASAAGSAIDVLSARLSGLGCLSCGRKRGKDDNQCPKEDSPSCKEAVRERRRSNAAEATDNTHDL